MAGRKLRQDHGRWAFDLVLGTYGTIMTGPRGFTYASGRHGHYCGSNRHHFRFLSRKQVCKELHLQAQLALPGLHCHLATSSHPNVGFFYDVDQFRQAYYMGKAGKNDSVIKWGGDKFRYDPGGKGSPVEFLPARIVCCARSTYVDSVQRRIIDATRRTRLAVATAGRPRTLPRGVRTSRKLGTWACAEVSLPDGTLETREVPLDLLFEIDVTNVYRNRELRTGQC